MTDHSILSTMIKTFGWVSAFHIWVTLAMFKIFHKKEVFYLIDFVLAANASGVGSRNKDAINESFYIASFHFSLIPAGLRLILETNIEVWFSSGK